MHMFSSMHSYHLGVRQASGTSVNGYGSVIIVLDFLISFIYLFCFCQFSFISFPDQFSFYCLNIFCFISVTSTTDLKRYRFKHKIEKI